MTQNTNQPTKVINVKLPTMRELARMQSALSAAEAALAQVGQLIDQLPWEDRRDGRRVDLHTVMDDFWLDGRAFDKRHYDVVFADELPAESLATITPVPMPATPRRPLLVMSTPPPPPNFDDGWLEANS